VTIAPPYRVLAAVTAVATAGGIGAAVSQSPPAGAANPVTHRLPLAIGTPDLACPGPETLLVPPGARAVPAKGPVQVAVMAADASGTATAGTRLRVRPLAVEPGDAVTAPAGDLAGGLSVRVGPGGIVGGLLEATGAGAAVVESPTTGAAAPPLLAGVQATVAAEGDLRGLATTTCTAASADTWLVGGATTTGHRLRLLLANPAATPATVDVAVHGPKGRVRAPSGENLTVPPRSSLPVFVDALAPDLPAVAVHVTAHAGRVQATLHSSVLRGLTPGGTDDVPPGAPPSRRQVVPGIAIAAGPGNEEPAARDDEDGEDGADDSDGAGRGKPDPLGPGRSAIRVAVPGTEEAVVSVKLLGPEGEVDLGRPPAVNVRAGGVVDIPVTGLPAAVYSAVVTSDVPVVAGAIAGRAAGPDDPAEFAWTAATRPLTADRLVTLVPGTTGYLSLVAAGHSGQVTVREVFPRGRLGDRRVLDVYTGQSPGMGVEADAVGLLVEDVVDGPITAALVQTVGTDDGTLISVRPVAPAAATARPKPRAVQDPGLGLPRRADDGERAPGQSSRP
jgi:hypothetical protein